ncbi:MAG: hypothetical protein ACK4RK_03040 [Gemmataceae bacterium]
MDTESDQFSDGGTDNRERSSRRRAAPDEGTLVRWLDYLLMGAVLLLAFLLASFPARNSDIWLHLASGRLLADGRYTFGEDPFAYTTQGVYWVNHSWLYDGILYGFCRLLGGPEVPFTGTVLVVGKALLVALLAWLLLAIRRPGSSVWLPCVGVALALLAMSPRLTLQPVCISLFLLGLTLYLLQRPPVAPISWWWWWCHRWMGGRSWVWLPVICALWANLDEWFFLGPVTIGLFWLGRLVPRWPFRPDAAKPQREERSRLAWIVGICFAATLLNPHGWHVWQAPVELSLSPWTATLARDPDFRFLFHSPFRSNFLQSPGGFQWAGLAYYLLLGLGAFSFLLSGAVLWGKKEGQEVWWRVLIWGAFASLSMSLERTIPFFAVVAGPIMVLNWQDVVQCLWGTRASASLQSRQWARAGRFLTLLGGMGLLVLAWPGWLHPYADHPERSRRVAWSLEIDPALVQAARQIHEWREQRIIPETARSLCLQPSVANYLTWFCPGEKHFLDHRYRLFAGRADDVVEIGQAFFRPRDYLAARADDEHGYSWSPLFEQHGITFVIFHARDPERLRPVLENVLTDPDHWSLAYLDGRVCIVGWQDPRRALRLEPEKVKALTLFGWPSLGGPVSGVGSSWLALDAITEGKPPPLNLHQLAFGSQVDLAPGQGPGRPPRLPTSWDLYRSGVQPAPLASDEARMYLIIHEILWRYQRESALRAWQAMQSAEAVASVGMNIQDGTPAWGVIGRQTMKDALFLTWHEHQTFGQAALPLLALRAARRSLRSDPDHAASYLALANAYNVLRQVQESRWEGEVISGLMPRQLLQRLPDSASHSLLPDEPFPIPLSPWITRQISPRQQLRQGQVIGALRLYTQLEPDSALAHLFLAELFLEMNYFDLALEHFRLGVPLLKEAGPLPGQDPREHRQQLHDYTERLWQLEQDVRDLQKVYMLRASARSRQDRALLAFYPFGLVDESLTNLMELEPEEVHPREIELVVYLLFTSGQLDQMRRFLAGGPPLGTDPRYDYHQALHHAAVGDYDLALKHLAIPLKQLEELPRTPDDSFSVLKKHHADLLTLAGVIALEKGDNDEAARYFQQALSLEIAPRRWTAPLTALAITSPLTLPMVLDWSGRAALPPFFPSHPVAIRYYLELQRYQGKLR